MEYIEGKTIGTLIAEQGAIPSAIAVKLVRQVAMGLEHAHRKGLIHRDVNPYNILVTRDGTAKLADLGLAINLAEEDRVTREGATVGTFDYVAHEQARQSHSADIRSDIYSLGCSLYHMCTGHVPFPTPSLPEKLFAHQAMEPAPLEQFVPDLPAGLSQVIKRMMHKSPDERFATPLQVAEALEPFGDEYGKAESRSDAQLLTSAATSESARHIEAKAELLEIAAQSDAANLTAAQATGFGLKSPSDPAFEHDASRESKIASTVRSPDSGQGSDPEFPVNLILSPEPSLTEGLSRPKSRTLTSNSGTSSEGTVLARLPRFSLWGLSALTFTVMLIVVTLAVVNPFGETKGSLKKAPVPPVNKDAESLRKSTETSDNAANKSIPPSDIIVRIEGESDQAFTSDKFVDAIRVAMGSRGRVELRNSKPLRLSSANLKPLGFGTASGGLIISAAPKLQTRHRI